VNLHEFNHTVNTLYPLHVPLVRHTDYTVDIVHRDIVHRSPVKEHYSPSKTMDYTSDHKLEMARRELNRSRAGLSLSGQKGGSLLNTSTHVKTHSGRKLLFSDESSYAGMIVDTISKDNRSEELREKVSDLPDFNFFDAYLVFER